MDDPVVESETEDPVTTTVALRRPDVPTTINELAALKGEAIEIIQAREQIIATLRSASIRATNPEDWLLFKTPDDLGGQIVGYLQDCGCDRVRDLWGIEVFDVGRPEKVTGTEPGVFHYLITGSGRCKITRQIVETMEGGRSSTDDFCRDKTGADLELAVRKAARANLDGNITRELSGLKSVPLAEIERAWSGSAKKIEHCRLGRGFGSSRERRGGTVASKEPDVKPPVCGICGAAAKWYPANDRGPAWYGCSEYKKHQDRKWSITEEKWLAQQTAPSAVPAGDEPRTTIHESKASDKDSKKATRVTQNDIPWASNQSLRGREPGEDG
jgi:hypothetical protein